MSNTSFEYRGCKVEIILGKEDDSTGQGYFHGSRALINGSPACMRKVNGTIDNVIGNVCEFIDKTSKSIDPEHNVRS